MSNNQMYLRHSADSDFVCENEYFSEFDEAPDEKIWVTISSKKNIELVQKEFNKCIDTLVKDQYLDRVVEKYSTIEDAKSVPITISDQGITSDSDSDSDSNRFVVTHDEKINRTKEHIIVLRGKGEEKLKHILISFCYDYDSITRIIIHCNKTASSYINTWVTDFKTEIITNPRFDYKSDKDITQPRMSIMASGQGGLHKLEFDLVNFNDGIKTMIDTHYNDGFKNFSDDLIHKLSTTDKGIVFLYGDPGTGKTNYIRYLAHKIHHKDMIYIPPDLTSLLTGPDFIEFVLNNPNSIFVVEDAENAIESRSNLRSSAVTNLLNLSDGIIGEAARSQFICTLNCNISQIDDALKRPGRLLGEYEFTKLSLPKTNALLKTLFDKTAKSKKALSLAEIYAFRDTNYDKPIQKKVRKPIGLG